MSTFPQISAFLDTLATKSVCTGPMLSFQLDLLEEKANAGDTSVIPLVEDVCNRLMNTIDPIRKKYWSYRLNQFESIVRGGKREGKRGQGPDKCY